VPQGIPSNPLGSFCIGTANARLPCRMIEKRRQTREMRLVEGCG